MKQVVQLHALEYAIVGQAIVFRGLPALPCKAGDKKAIACPNSNIRTLVS
jgi:hypothetical protein